MTCLKGNFDWSPRRGCAPPKVSQCVKTVKKVMLFWGFCDPEALILAKPAQIDAPDMPSPSVSPRSKTTPSAFNPPPNGGYLFKNVLFGQRALPGLKEHAYSFSCKNLERAVQNYPLNATLILNFHFFLPLIAQFGES